MSTVCSHAKHKYSKKLASKETMDELEKIYDDWLVAQSNLKSKQDFYDMRKEFDGIHFNNQVRAPYLLVYTKKKDMVTESQKQSDYYKSGKVTSIFQTNKPIDSNNEMPQRFDSTPTLGRRPGQAAWGSRRRDKRRGGRRRCCGWIDVLHQASVVWLHVDAG